MQPRRAPYVVRTLDRALLLAAAVSAAWPRCARAEDDAARQTLAVHAEWHLGPLAACADPRALSADVSAVLGRDAFVADAAVAERTLHVSARQDSIDAWILEVRASQAGEADGVRRLFLGPVSCAEARRAVVEVLALAVDYDATAPPDAPIVQAPLQLEPEPQPPEAGWVGHLGADFVVGWGLLPGTHGGVSVAGALQPPGSAWSVVARGVLWGPAATATGGIEGLRYGAWSWHVGLSACRRFFDGSPLELRLCGGGLAGQILESVTVSQPDRAATPSNAPRLLGLDFGVGLATSSRRPVQLVVDAGAIVTLVAPSGTFCGVRVSPSDGRCEGELRPVTRGPEVLVPRVQVGLRWRVD